MRIFSWTLQILILAAGIHLFLRFVRTTHGSRLIRGLFVFFFVVVAFLWGLSKALDLEELEHLLQASTGVAVLTFAIIFQPELRRGIAQIGERSFVGRFIRPSGPDTVRRVARAAHNLSLRRVGALIAFERESSLTAVLESGTSIDAVVRARVLESLFQPGGALHDGAVVIRKDRIAAAGCILPLSTEVVLDSAMGTRHRAAVALSEETDALVLVVSEATGAISLARGGKLERDLSHDTLEGELLRELSRFAAGPETIVPRLLPALASSLRRDKAWIAGALLIAAGVLFVAHQDIRERREFTLRVVDAASVERGYAQSGEVLVLLPRQVDLRLSAPTREQEFHVSVSGTRRDLAQIEGALAATYVIEDPEFRNGPLELSRMRWRDGGRGLTRAWIGSQAPELVVERYGMRVMTVSKEGVRVDASALDPRFEADLDGLTFEPSRSLFIRGPLEVLPRLGTSLPVRLDTLLLTIDDRDDRVERVRLSAELCDLGLDLAPGETVNVRLPIRPRRRELGSVEKEIALVSLDPGGALEASSFALSGRDRLARFELSAIGLLGSAAEANDPRELALAQALASFAEHNLLVFVDVSERAVDGILAPLPVRWTWRVSWRDSLEALGLERGSLTGEEELLVRLTSASAVQVLDGVHAADEEGGR